MKNRIALFFLLFIASITLLFYLLNREMEAKYNQHQWETLELENSFNKMNEELNKTLTHTTVQNIIIEDTLLQQLSLSDLVSRSPVLIFRFSELACTACYETEFLSLRNIFPNTKQQIVFLSSYGEKRHFIMFKRSNQIEFPFFRIPQDAFDWALEDYGLPYYFVLHPDLTVSHIYIPDAVLPELNRQYLEEVKKYLSSK